VSPARWVPSLYFAMGTPMVTVSVVAAIMYKNLGLSNSDVALYTGSMYLPWVLKPLWAPWLELWSDKRSIVLGCEAVMAVTLACVALSLGLEHYLAASLAFLWLTGFASATQDIAADGLYIAAMKPRQQARYVGIQGIAWNVGRLLASGLLVEVTEFLHGTRRLSWPATWAIVMLVIGAIMALSAAWHARVLPKDGTASRSRSARDAGATFVDAWLSFFAKPQIGWMIAVVFFYRFGEGFIEKVGPLFLMDAREVGGLGLDNGALGRIYGSYATGGFLAGTLLGGWFAARLGLRRAFWLLALALNIPHLTYFFLSVARPESLELIAAVVTLEKLGYGFGSVGHMLYMMQQLAPGPYRTAHYAFATGLMGLSMMLTGMASGVLQEWLGHQAFFAAVLVASVPPIVLAWLAPFPHGDAKSGDGGAAPQAAPPSPRFPSVPATPPRAAVPSRHRYAGRARPLRRARLGVVDYLHDPVLGCISKPQHVPRQDKMNRPA
jgi:PAT family beta-lactamase induction signal transducer AmpG